MDIKDKKLVKVIQNAKHIINVMDNVNSVIIEDGNDNIKIVISREENKDV